MKWFNLVNPGSEWPNKKNSMAIHDIFPLWVLKFRDKFSRTYFTVEEPCSMLVKSYLRFVCLKM